MKIYVASSWRNERQQEVVNALREAGHEVYDFKNPAPGNTGFSWSEIDPEWQAWTTEQYRQALQHPIAERGFNSDFDAMKWADVCVLLLPCGRSAHSEAGWMQGKDKPTIVLQFDKAEPELMYKMYHSICTNICEVLAKLDCIAVDLRDTEKSKGCLVQDQQLAEFERNMCVVCESTPVDELDFDNVCSHCLND